ncbi:hypothetical protein A9K55_001781 [Cordyceps militaris]|uniref:Uncharacterized protein n=1 Tax=Cordyceps militaris TaxID=73501 RepID=A0A2H4SSS6_CORMI|nr:hypothetical protein A9K55_001781 [Cordyceps militaris]
MLFYRTALLLLAGRLSTASVLSPHSICSESAKRICYEDDGGESQGLDRAHVQYVADYLRFLGRSGDTPFWTMPREEAGGCGEWTLPVPGAAPVLPLAKHTSPWLASSVLYEDLAAAVDGDGGLLACGEAGGQVGVVANVTNPLYDGEEYKKTGAKPEGILMKLVRAPRD